jgi:hypothetical protein
MDPTLGWVPEERHSGPAEKPEAVYRQKLHHHDRRKREKGKERKRENRKNVFPRHSFQPTVGVFPREISTTEA